MDYVMRRRSTVGGALPLPAFSANAERSFSTLRHLKNYLRLTRPMTQERLNHVAVHHVHKTRVDALDIKK